MSRIPQEHPSSASRFNQMAKFTLSAFATLLPSAWFSDPIMQTAVGSAMAAGVLALYDRIYAAAFVNRNHQPQVLYEMPWREGVLVVQARHHLRLNPYRPWRLRFRDEMAGELYTIHGYFATRALADQYCQNASKMGIGRYFDAQDPHPMLRRLADAVDRAANQRYAELAPQALVPQSAWTVHGASQGTGYFASRRLLTRDGPRWQFFPPPSQTLADTALLKRHLTDFQDAFLDRRNWDATLDPLPQDAVRAWRRQAGPWQLVPLDPAHDRWVAVQTGPDGAVRAWEPPVPQTRARADVVAALLPDLAPGLTTVEITADPAGWGDRWRQAAWRTAPNGPAWRVPVTHPWVRQHVTAPRAPDTWHVVPWDGGWGAVQVQPAGAHVALRLWTWPEQPSVPVTAPDPATCAHRLAAVWPEATIVVDPVAPPGPSGPTPPRAGPATVFPPVVS